MLNVIAKRNRCNLLVDSPKAVSKIAINYSLAIVIIVSKSAIKEIVYLVLTLFKPMRLVVVESNWLLIFWADREKVVLRLFLHVIQSA